MANPAVSEVFERCRSEGRAAFIPYVTGGYPDPDTSMRILPQLESNGADIIEIGLPFSDPMADGPTIQDSSREALSAGASVRSILEMLPSAMLDCPVVVMSYLNPLIALGLREFAEAAAGHGVSGVIIPDLPPEESEEWLGIAREKQLDTIFLAAPTTTASRLETILSATRGYLYYVCLTGVTGASQGAEGVREAIGRVREIRARSPVPVAAGFGISGPGEAGEFAGVADGVIVGSALIRAIASAPDRASMPEAAGQFCRQMRNAICAPHRKGR